MVQIVTSFNSLCSTALFSSFLFKSSLFCFIRSLYPIYQASLAFTGSARAMAHPVLPLLLPCTTLQATCRAHCVSPSTTEKFRYDRHKICCWCFYVQTCVYKLWVAATFRTEVYVADIANPATLFTSSTRFFLFVCHSFFNTVIVSWVVGMTTAPVKSSTPAWAASPMCAGLRRATFWLWWVPPVAAGASVIIMEWAARASPPEEVTHCVFSCVFMCGSCVLLLYCCVCGACGKSFLSVHEELRVSRKRTIFGTRVMTD